MGQSAEGFLRRAAHCERLAEEMGNPQLAEAFRRLASHWCHAAVHVADLEQRFHPTELMPSAEVELPRLRIGCPKVPGQFPLAPNRGTGKNPPLISAFERGERLGQQRDPNRES